MSSDPNNLEMTIDPKENEGLEKSPTETRKGLLQFIDRLQNKKKFGMLCYEH